jgi:lipoprotein-anchoring transpeptidase ErfK/SrfK
MIPANVLRIALLAATLVSAVGLQPALAGAMVAYDGPAPIGTIVVDTGARQLYLVLQRGKAMLYPVGVGREGRQWTGVSKIAGRFSAPGWVPPDMIRRDRPDLPALIPGGSPSNPMGAAAMTLSGGNYAIHGTNDPGSIGGFVSYGCIRMHNDDIVDLMSRVHVGTRVEVVL